MSNINPQNIDGTFPIAGQDNNSQGFRDNFTNTINNFTFAASELSDLQTYAVVTGPLTSVGQTGTPTNNMNYTYLTKPQLLGAVQTSKNIGNIATSGTIQVDWSQGHYQTVGATGSVSLSFTSTWPTTSLYTKLRLQIKAWGTTTIALDPKVSVNVNSIQGVSANVLTLSDGVYAFEFSTADAGATIVIRDLRRNYAGNLSSSSATFTTANITGNLTVTTITTATGSNGNIIFDPDGLADVVLTNNTNLYLLDSSPSTSTTSGTIISFGGAGIAGNIYSGAYINAASGIVNSGAQIETGYQQVKPSANVAVTVNSNVNRVLLHPASSIISFGANVTLPNTQIDGTIISISSNVTIAQLAVVTPWVGTTVSPYGNAGPITSGTVSRYMYINADKIWYKIA
jgi:hypothetical protein